MTLRTLFQRILIPLLLVGAMLAIVALSGALNIKWDLTREKKHTLTSGSQTLLAELDRPVAVRFYLSGSDNSLPIALRKYAERVDALLSSVADASKGMVQVERLDPGISADAEESAFIDGIEKQTLGKDSHVHMGISFGAGTNRAVLPIIDPSLDNALEYEVLSRIRKVAKRKRTQLGVISSVPIAQPGIEWQVIHQLRDTYDVLELGPRQPIPEDVSIIMLVHPRGVNAKFNRKIDSFTQRGGSLLVLMDSISLSLSFNDRSAALSQLSSSWPALADATGLSFSGKNAVADQVFSSQLNRGEGVETINSILTMDTQSISGDIGITAGLGAFNFPISGTFTGIAHPELTQTSLLQSTADSALIDGQTVLTDGKQATAQAYAAFQADPQIYPLAVLVEGTLRSFETGKVRPDATASTIILIGDSDFIADPYAGRMVDTPAGQSFTPINNNIALVFNIFDYLENETLLNEARARTKTTHPLSKLAEFRREVERIHQDKLVSLEKSLTQLEQAKNSESSTPGANARSGDINLTYQGARQERQGTITATRAKVAAVRRTITNEKNQITSQIKWLNILVAPVIIGLCGIIFLSIRSYKTRAGRT